MGDKQTERLAPVDEGRAMDSHVDESTRIEFKRGSIHSLEIIRYTNDGLDRPYQQCVSENDERKPTETYHDMQVYRCEPAQTRGPAYEAT